MLGSNWQKFGKIHANVAIGVAALALYTFVMREFLI
jgi:hypothetical protein